MTVLAGRFELVRELAQGGMAVVHLAVDLASGENVVVKRLHPHLARDPQLVALFVDEGQTMRPLRHPHLVRLIEVVREPGELALVLEHVPGANLRALVRAALARGEVPPAAVVTWVLARAAEGLHAAHEAKDEATGAPLAIVHRDVSPDNVLVSAQGDVKVSDFGIALAESRITHTQPGLLRGKPRFMAPEQLLSRPIDRRADVWSLGVSWYESVTGHKAFEADSIAAIAHAVVTGPLPHFAALRPDLPPFYDEVLARVLCRDVAARTPDALTLARELDAVVAQAGAPVGPADVTRWLEALIPQALRDFGATPGDDLELDADGRLVRRESPAMATSAREPAPFEPAPASRPPEPLAFAPQEHAPLELAWTPKGHSSRPGEPEDVRRAGIAGKRPVPPPRAASPHPAGPPSAPWGWPFALAAVALIAVGVAWVRHLEAADAEPPPLDAATAAPPAHEPTPFRQAPLEVHHHTTEDIALLIDSRPAGAEVRLNGRRVGETPWGGNDLDGGVTVVTLTLRGYQRWSRTLDAGQGLIETVDLQRAPR